MKIVIATVPGRFPGNRYPCPFPSRWTSIAVDYPTHHFYPYELAYLSALLKRELPEASTKLLDGSWLRFTVEDYIRRLETEKPEWLIFEVDTVTYAQTMLVTREMKKRFGTKVIMTGQYPTAFPEKVIEDGNDYACIGEYEATVLDILKGEDPKTISGLYPNKYRKVLDIDWLPFPEDEDIRRIDYSHPGGYRWMQYREIEMFASRGCPYSCDFCVAGSVYYEKPNWRFRKPGNIISEIETMRRRYPQMEGAFFDEETHIVNKKKILEFCDALEASGNNDLHYEAMANYQFLDEELLVALKRAGYYKLRIGIESVNLETGKSIGRKTAPKKLEKLLKIAKKVGIEVYGSFVVGASGSTCERDMETVEYGKRILSQDLLSSWQASIAVPHPGTPFYKKAVANGWLNTDNLELFNGTTQGVVNYPDYSANEIWESYNTMSRTFTLASGCDTLNMIKSSYGEKTAVKKSDRDAVRQRIGKLTSLFLSCDYEKTVKEAEDVIKEFPQLLKSRFIMASAYERLGKADEAKKWFEDVVVKGSDYEDARFFASGAHYHLGTIYIDEGDVERALTNFRLCMHLDPDHKKARQSYWDIIGNRKVGEAEVKVVHSD